MKIFVKAKPGAKKARVEEMTGLFAEQGERRFVVAVNERAVDGKANRAIEAALAGYFNVKPSQVRIVSGHTSRDKVVEIV
jgi:hypothetical protein